MKSRVHSASSLKTLEQCELQYYLKYVDKALRVEDPDSTHAAPFGTAVHYALEFLYKMYMKNPSKRFSPNDYEKVRTAFLKSAAEESVYDVVLLEEGWSIVKERMDSFDYSEKVISIEKKFSVKTPGGTRFMGFIDKVVELSEDAIAIVDYKTSRMAMPQATANSDIQLSMYDLAASILWPQYKTVVLVLDYLRLMPVMSYRTITQRKLFSDFLDQTEKSILSRKEESVKPTLNSLCGWCSFTAQCPAFIKATECSKEVTEAISKPSKDEMITEWTRLKTVSKAIGVATRTLQMKIEEHMKEAGDEVVHGSKDKITATQSTRVSYRIDSLRGVIPDADLLSLCTVNKSSIDKYLADHKDLAKTIRDSAVVSYTTPSFRVSKNRK